VCSSFYLDSLREMKDEKTRGKNKQKKLSLVAAGALAVDTPEARRAVAAHNTMTRALVSHESAWVQAWSASAEATLAAGLAVPLVVWSSSSSSGAAAAAGGGSGGRARSSSGGGGGGSRSSSRSSSSTGDAVSSAPASAPPRIQRGQAAAAPAGHGSDARTLSLGLDRRVLAASADARWMLRLGCDVPPRAAAAAASEGELRLLSASLRSSIETAASLPGGGDAAPCSPRLCALLSPHVAVFEAWLAARGAELTWTSPRARALAEEARERSIALVDLSERLRRALESGVDEQLEGAAAVDVLGLLGRRGAGPLSASSSSPAAAAAVLPPPPLRPSEFAAAASEASHAARLEFARRSEAAAAGCEEIATMLSDAAAAAAVAEADIPVSSSSPLSASPSLSPSPASSSSFFSQQPATLVALRAHVQHRFRRAVASSVAASLAELREHILSVSSGGSKETCSASPPLFTATLELGARGPELDPRPLELQGAVDAAVDAAVAAGASLAPWGGVTSALENGSALAAATTTQQQQSASSSSSPPSTIADAIAGDARVLCLALALSGVFSEERTGSFSSSSSPHSVAAATALGPFARFSHLWTRDAATDVAAFAATLPDVEAFVPKLAEHAAMIKELSQLQQQQQQQEVSTSSSTLSSSSFSSSSPLFAVDARPLVSALIREASAWTNGYLRSLRALASADLAKASGFVRSLGGRLGGGGGRGKNSAAASAASAAKVDSLIDARSLADALDELSSKTEEIAETAARVERAYELLEAHGGKEEEAAAETSPSPSGADPHADARSEADAAATLSYELKKLHRAGAAASSALEARRPALEQDLAREASLLAADADALCAEWAAATAALLLSGSPSSASGGSSTSSADASSSFFSASLTPFVVKARLKGFSEAIAARSPRWEAAAAARAVFGLPPLRHEGLSRATAEVAGLSRLYALHCDVTEAIERYSALPWVHHQGRSGADSSSSSPSPAAVDVFDATAEMAERVAGFQAAALSLPKTLKEWPAYALCRASVDRVAARVPLLALLAHRAMRRRHWGEVRALLSQQQQGEEPLPPMPFADGDDVAFSAAAAAVASASASASSSSPATTALHVGHLLSADLPSHRLAIEDIAARALKEQAIELKLSALAATWSAARLSFADHKDRGPMVLKPSDTAELLESLEDSLVTLGSLASNRHALPFRERLVVPWQGRLSAVAEALERWLAVQSMWCYIEAVFSGGDIVRQLPAEARRFAAIDRGFVKVVSFAREAGGVLEACLGRGGGGEGNGTVGNGSAPSSSSSASSSSPLPLLASTLPHLLEQFELCQKSLTAYLEGKRALFPRFYFVSDPTLLEILSQGSDPRAVAQHFQSGLFDSLASLAFESSGGGGGGASGGAGRAQSTAAATAAASSSSPSSPSSSSSSSPLALSNRIVEMVSAQGERVRLDRAVEATGMVETWLSRLVDGMKSTVRANLKAAVRAIAQAAAAADGGATAAAATASSPSSSSSAAASPPTPPLTPADVVLSFPSQAALLALQYLWTAETQAALRAAARGDRGAPARALVRAEALLSLLVAATLRPGLTKNQRTSLETCITVHMHQKEATGTRFFPVFFMIISFARRNQKNSNRKNSQNFQNSQKQRSSSASASATPRTSSGSSRSACTGTLRPAS